MFLLQNCMSSLYILDINLLSDMCFTDNFSSSIGCFFMLLMVFFPVQTFFSLMQSVFYFCVQAIFCLYVLQILCITRIIEYLSFCYWLISLSLMSSLWEKPSSSCVSPLFSDYYHFHNTSPTTCVWVFPHQTVLWDMSWVSCSLSQF